MLITTQTTFSQKNAFKEELQTIVLFQEYSFFPFHYSVFRSLKTWLLHALLTISKPSKHTRHYPSLAYSMATEALTCSHRHLKGFHYPSSLHSSATAGFNFATQLNYLVNKNMIDSLAKKDMFKIPFLMLPIAARK